MFYSTCHQFIERKRERCNSDSYGFHYNKKLILEKANEKENIPEKNQNMQSNKDIRGDENTVTPKSNAKINKEKEKTIYI